jgi:hypothetical protein
MALRVMTQDPARTWSGATARVDCPFGDMRRLNAVLRESWLAFLSRRAMT